MSALKTLYDFLGAYRHKFGSEPKLLFIDKAEAKSLRSEATYMLPVANPFSSSCVFAGKEMWETPYADMQRQRCLELNLATFVSGPHTVSDGVSKCVLESCRDEARREMAFILRANVLTDQTEITVTFEWDIMATIKRNLRLTRWWPVKNRSVTISGRVLYPFLEVQLPNHIHTVRFWNKGEAA